MAIAATVVGCYDHVAPVGEYEAIPKDREGRDWVRERQLDAQDQHYQDRLIDRWNR